MSASAEARGRPTGSDVRPAICSPLKRRDWSRFDAYCGLQENLVEQELAAVVERTPRAIAVLELSFLSAAMREQYARGMNERVQILR